MQREYQKTSWTSFAGTTAVNPNPDRVVAQNEQWEWFSDENPQVTTGTTPRTTLTGNFYLVTNPDYSFGISVIQSRELGTWEKVYIDDIVMEEYDVNGTFVRTNLDTPADLIADWYFWSANTSGTGELAAGVSGESGGTNWVTDILDVLTVGNINYNYHIYHETNFGLHTNGDWEFPYLDVLNIPLATHFETVQN